MAVFTAAAIGTVLFVGHVIFLHIVPAIGLVYGSYKSYKTINA